MEVQVPERARGRLSGRWALVLPLAAACAVALPACGRTEQAADPVSQVSEPGEVVLTPEAALEGRERADEKPGRARSRARVVELRGAGAEPPVADERSGDAPSPGAPTDAEVRTELRQALETLANFKQHLNTTAFLRTGPQARVLADGSAMAPENAPDVVKRVILAANEIARFPYKWGGGHGAWRDDGYDCSGSVSFALAGAGLLGSPLTSGGFLDYGAPGPGRWITIYTNYGHIFMVVAGLRFDTSGRGRAGTRWQEAPRSTYGFEVRHIPGL